MLLANSKAFLKFHSSLDVDFQNDIIPKEDLSEWRTKIIEDDQLLSFFKKLMKEDSVI